METARYLFDTDRRFWRPLAGLGALAAAAALFPRSAGGSASRASEAKKCLSAPNIKKLGIDEASLTPLGWELGFRISYDAHGGSGVLGLDNVDGGGRSYIDSFRYGPAHQATDYFRGSFTEWGVGNHEVEATLSSECGTSRLDFVFAVPAADQLCLPSYDVDVHGLASKANAPTLPGREFTQELRRLTHKSVRLLADPLAVIGGAKVMASAVAHKGSHKGRYYDQLEAAKRWLSNEVSSLSEECPGSDIYVSALSLGAQAAGDVLETSVGQKITGMALFGDPTFNPKDSSARFGYERQRQTPAQDRTHGALGRRRAFNSPKVLSYCHESDLVCNRPRLLHLVGAILHKNIQHTTYGTYGEPEAAAGILAKH